jgi:hypothetical protein
MDNMKSLFLQLAQLIDPNDVGVQPLSAGDVLQNGLNITYFIAGIIAVIVIIVGGIMYATSSGEAGNVTKAKNLILFAVVGLVVIFSAFAITNFVMGSF